jgi:HPt (histidine-containing phosphotransfer) domain-containing protein
MLFLLQIFCRIKLGNLNRMNYKYINTEYLETVVSGGDKEIIIELITIFHDQVIEITTEMKSFLEVGDFLSLGMLAHKAKSSVAIMGMNDLAIMLKTFELEGKEGVNNENYKGYIERYEREASLAVSELEHYVNNK